ncbi:MAG: hypothetical protein V3R87_02065 [Dehalococcoidia bacterium]
MQDEVQGDGSKSGWGIDPTPNPMRVMITQMLLGDLRNRIREDPEAAIEHIDAMLARLD